MRLQCLPDLHTVGQTETIHLKKPPSDDWQLVLRDCPLPTENSLQMTIIVRKSKGPNHLLRRLELQKGSQKNQVSSVLPFILRSFEIR